MKAYLILAGALLPSLILTSCQTPYDRAAALRDSQTKVKYSINRSLARIENEQFLAGIGEQIGDGSSGATGFVLYIQNKSTLEIEIDWNRTLFIDRGQTSGGFMVGDTVISKRDEPRRPDFVLPNSTFRKLIVPNNRVYFLTSYRLAAIDEVDFQPVAGQYGVSLALRIDGKEL